MRNRAKSKRTTLKHASHILGEHARRASSGVIFKLCDCDFCSFCYKLLDSRWERKPDGQSH